MHDALGDRMKKQYEDRTRTYLPRRTYTIIRLDGKAFHTLTRNFDKPYDRYMSEWMDATALKLCKEIQGAQFAYTQSDEISILLTDFEKDTTEAWFDGNLQKMVSISASIATAEFNRLLYWDNRVKKDTVAYFDSRIFTIADWVEVANYFQWRQKDAIRNSIQMLAQSLYSHKELMNKNTNQLQEMCFKKQKNWNDVEIRNKIGGFVCRESTFHHTEGDGEKSVDIYRSNWIVTSCFDFSVMSLEKYIPKIRGLTTGTVVV